MAGARLLTAREGRGGQPWAGKGMCPPSPKARAVESMKEESGEDCSGHRVTVSNWDDCVQSRWPIWKDSAVEDQHLPQDEAAKVDPRKPGCLCSEQPLLCPWPGDLSGCL